MRHAEFARAVLASGWCVCPGFIPPARTDALREIAQAAWRQGQFHRAGVGRGTAAGVRQDIRGDSILWLDECESTAVQAFLAMDIAVLQQALNAAGYLGLHEFEGQFAVYPPGAYYARHLDRFRNHDARVISLVLYLNADWNGADGGELCLYPGADTVTVSPTAGTLAGFLSAEVPHEVKPARRERFSLSGWFRRRA